MNTKSLASRFLLILYEENFVGVFNLVNFSKVAKFKFRQYKMRAVSPNLMLTKVTCYTVCIFLLICLNFPEEYCGGGMDWLRQDEHLQSWTQGKGDDRIMHEYPPLCDIELMFCIAGGYYVHNCWSGQLFLPRSLAHTWYVVEVTQCVL